MNMFDKLFRRRERKEVKAVYNDEVISLLESLEIRDEIENGDLRCRSCGGELNLQNVGAIVPGTDGISVRCDKLECTLAEYADENFTKIKK